jgi:hypothetical protein
MSVWVTCLSGLCALLAPDPRGLLSLTVDCCQAHLALWLAGFTEPSSQWAVLAVKSLQFPKDAHSPLQVAWPCSSTQVVLLSQWLHGTQESSFPITVIMNAERSAQLQTCWTLVESSCRITRAWTCLRATTQSQGAVHMHVGQNGLPKQGRPSNKHQASGLMAESRRDYY